MQSPDMTTRIPAELISYIIGFLQDSKATLSACSLCCSTLAAASRPLLFHTLTTGSDSIAADRFECLLKSGSGVLPLIKRIDVAIPTFKPGVDRAITAISQILAYRHKQDTPPVLKIVIRSMTLGRFPSGGPFPAYLNSAVHWVTSLELHHLDLTGGAPLLHLVLAFPRLKYLTLGSVKAETRAHLPSHRELGISHISLKETAFDDNSNISWLLVNHPLPLPSLTSIDVRLPTVPDRDLMRFGEEYGPTVKTLRFGVVIVRHLTINRDKLACEF